LTGPARTARGRQWRHSLFAKTGTRRQTELVKLVAGNSGAIMR
jgi:hypothetical protein